MKNADVPGDVKLWESVMEILLLNSEISYVVELMNVMFPSRWSGSVTPSNTRGSVQFSKVEFVTAPFPSQKIPVMFVIMVRLSTSSPPAERRKRDALAFPRLVLEAKITGMESLPMQLNPP